MEDIEDTEATNLSHRKQDVIKRLSDLTTMILSILFILLNFFSVLSVNTVAKVLI